MLKTPLKHRHTAAKRITRRIKHAAHDDVNKIKAFLWETSKDFRRTAGKKSIKAQNYLSKRPVKTMGVSLVTGVLAGLCIGYFINTDR